MGLAGTCRGVIYKPTGRLVVPADYGARLDCKYADKTLLHVGCQLIQTVANRCC